jgi:hypothetical protein
MQWAISEADRLDMDFDLSVDFGYGSGGPHITPDRSMQKLVWSDTVVQGGKPVTVKLAKPVVDYKPMLKKSGCGRASSWTQKLPKPWRKLTPTAISLSLL